MKWRKRGLELLFEFYTKYKGSTPTEICQQFHIEIVSAPSLNAGWDLPWCGGMLLFPGKNGGSHRIVLSSYTKAVEWVSSFIVGHELGHYCLLSHDLKAYSPDNLKEDLAQEMEYWCDGFATALLFSVHGVEILSADTYVEFLTSSLPRYPPGPKSDAFQGERILQLCQDNFTDPPQELLRLGSALVRSEEINARFTRS